MTIKSLILELKQWRSLYLMRRPLILALVVYIGLLLLGHSVGILDGISGLDPIHWASKRVAVTGVVISPPDPRPGSCVYILASETIRDLENYRDLKSVHGRVLIQIKRADETFAQPGDRLRVLGKIQHPNKAKVPGTFDYQAYLKTKKIFSVLYSSTRSAENLGPSTKFRLLQIGWTIRKRIFETFREHLSDQQTAVLSGLVVGNRPRFHPHIRKIFIESGTMHILVASGSNVAFVIAIWFWLSQILFRFPRKLALLASLPLAWLYVFIVGADPPIFRAGVMATIAIFAFIVSREDRAYHALSLAALTLLIFNPLMIFDVGFQMSFVAVFGMIYTIPKLEPFYNSRSIFTRWIARIILATLSAQIWITPVTLSVFKQFFPIGLVANIVVLPLSAFGLLTGFGLAFFQELHTLSLIFLLIRDGFVWLTKTYLTLLIGLVDFFASHPGISFWITPPNPLWVIGYYLFVFCLFLFIKSSWAKLGTVVGFALVVFSSVYAGRPSHKENLTFTWVDQGRSVCVLIETPQGEKILLNPGPSSPYNSAERVILPYLTEKRISKIDAVVINKSHPKQVSSLSTLIPHLDNPAVHICGNNNDSHWDIWMSSHPTIRFSVLNANQSLELEKLKIEVLSGSNAFNSDAPILVSYEDKIFVLSYVLPLKTQRELLARGLEKISVLQSRFSEKILWDDDFVGELAPETLVEIGYDSKTRPSAPPWPKPTLLIPQKLGFVEWKSP